MLSGLTETDQAAARRILRSMIVSLRDEPSRDGGGDASGVS
jgi:hypothetical protein